MQSSTGLLVLGVLIAVVATLGGIIVLGIALYRVFQDRR